MTYEIREYVKTKVDVETIRRVGETVWLRDVPVAYVGNAVDVYDEKGEIMGSLIYVPCVSVRKLKE